MSLNVLVVDDSAVMRSMVIKALGLSGLPIAEVLQAGNGQDALHLLADCPVDVALVDLNMPIMDGEELIRQVRARPAFAELPIIVVSTEGSFTRIAILRKQGAGFVHKPFSPETLRQAVSELTGVMTHDQSPDGAGQGSGPDF
jgi:two-component system, chemotaxis family, chemotaxis protein CheY